MKRKIALDTLRAYRPMIYHLLAAACLIVVWMPLKVKAQERFQNLYAPTTAAKLKIKSMTVELYASAEGLDSLKMQGRDPDYRERFFYDAQGHPSMYEATDINIRSQSLAGPHIVATYEYSADGLHSHRHDSTAFGHASEWHFEQDSLHRRTLDQMMLPGEEAPHTQRQYLYDARGRLQKIKTNRTRATEGLSDDCAWVFFVHDNQSFNATSLSPMDMARCACSLEYLNDHGRTVRRVVYDEAGAMAQTVLMTYDRTDKPSRLELYDGEGKVLQAWADVVYGRNGLVTVEANGVPGVDESVMARLAMEGQSFVVAHWADWRLLRELRTKVAGREISRHRFSYDLAG
jgi:hypothetical protein